MASLNWNQIHKDIRKYADLEKLKKELEWLKAEIRNLNLRAFLSPAAEKRLKDLEKKYAEVLRTVHRAQRQLDREVARFMRKFKTTRVEAEKKFDSLYDLAMTQKAWIEKTSMDFKKRVLSQKTAQKRSKKKASTRKKKAKR